MQKRNKLKIRINPANSPLNLIGKRLEHPTLILDELKEENQVEDFVDTDQHLDKLLLNGQVMADEEKHYDVQLQLLKMMYSDDVDAEIVVNNLGITRNQLKSIVAELVELGFLQFVSQDELEITEDGIKFIKFQDSKF